MFISQLSVSEDENVLSEEDVDRILKTFQNPLQLEQFIMEGNSYLFLCCCSFKILPVPDQIFTPRGVGLSFKQGRGIHHAFQGVKKSSFVTSWVV